MKILFLIILAIIFYFTGIVASKYDVFMTIMVASYKIEVSALFVSFVFIFCASILLLCFRTVSYIFYSPYSIMKRLKDKKHIEAMNLVLNVYSHMFMNNKTAAKSILTQVISMNDKTLPEAHIHFLNAVTHQDISSNLHLIQNLLSHPLFHDYALYIIVDKLYHQGLYESALSFIESDQNIKDDDLRLLYLRIMIYTKLDIWDNFILYIDKFLKFPHKNTICSNEDIAILYLQGARYHLTQGASNNAVFFLEQALLFNPINFDAIDMLCSLNLALNKQTQSLNLIESAFEVTPSFELFELYYISCDIPAEELYNKFTSVVNKEHYKSVFLAIAAYLKLSDEIDLLRSCTI